MTGHRIFGGTEIGLAAPQLQIQITPLRWGVRGSVRVNYWGQWCVAAQVGPVAVALWLWTPIPKKPFQLDRPFYHHERVTTGEIFLAVDEPAQADNRKEKK